MNNIITQTNVQEPVVPTEQNKMTIEEIREYFLGKKNLESKKSQIYHIETKNASWDDLEADEYSINGNFIVFKLKGETVLIASQEEFQYCEIAED